MQAIESYIVEKGKLQQQFDYMDKVAELLNSRKNADGPPLAYVHSYGCQQNVADGEKLQGMLAQMGFGFTGNLEDAHFILYNTCAIREHAEAKVFGNVGALKHLKRRNPELIIGLCGCMPQQEHISQKIKNSYPYVDLVFGTHSLHVFPQLVYEKLTQHQRVFDLRDTEGVIAEGLPTKRDGERKGWLSIMYGCNNFCTYCVVPNVRGRERSRRPDEILKEFREMVAAGYKDITLLGQNVNSYGKTLTEQMSFVELLDLLASQEGDFRIRFMTSHPRDFSRELVDVIAKHEKIVNQIHLPVQSGNNRILKLMNRHYTAEEYLEKLAYAREKIPDVSFTSDIIVGFPGESYSEFCDTLTLIDKVGYSSLFTFIFSKRKGTAAAEMEDLVSGEEKSKWFGELLERQRAHSERFYKNLVGKTLRVLAEGSAKSGEGYLSGKADNGVAVDFVGSNTLVGEFVNVKIVKPLNWAVLGEIV